MKNTHNSVPQLSVLSSVSLDFEDAKEYQNTDNARSDDLNVADDNSVKDERRADPLLKEVATFSLWHYQDPAVLQIKKQQQQQQQPESSSASTRNSNTSTAVDMIEIERLQFELEKYEAELKDAMNSSRAVDDIVADIQETKAALRRHQ